MGLPEHSRVVIVEADGALGAATRTACEQTGAAVVAVEAGPTGDTTAAVEAAIADLGGIDVLLNLTGSGAGVLPAADAGRDDWERMVKRTVRAARTSNQAAFRHMVDAGGGAIVNVCDHAAETGPSGRALASAAAQAVVALSNASAGAWFGTGVRINVAQPAAHSDVGAVVAVLLFLAGGDAALHGRTMAC